MKRNGLVLRVATGIAWSIARRLDLVLELVPTFWTTPRGVYPSVGPGLELSIGL
jgi:hypothetical protein